MSEPPRYSQVERLSPDHDVESFDCGSDAQSLWIRNHGRQSHTANYTQIYVVRRLADDVVVGFYATAVGAVFRGPDTPQRVTAGSGQYPIPVVVLARLGVDQSEQGRGLGRHLLRDALLRISAAAEHVGIRAVLIHAEDDQARDFYLRHAGFEPSPTDPLHLYLLLKDLRKALA